MSDKHRWKVRPKPPLNTGPPNKEIDEYDAKWAEYKKEEAKLLNSMDRDSYVLTTKTGNHAKGEWEFEKCAAGPWHPYPAEEPENEESSYLIWYLEGPVKAVDFVCYNKRAWDEKRVIKWSEINIPEGK